MVIRILLVFFSLYFNSILSVPLFVKADKKYSIGDINALGKLFLLNRKDRVVNYLYSKALLNKNIITNAEQFIINKNDDFMRSDLQHNLLVNYFNNNNYNKYISLYNIINNEDKMSISLNEKCANLYALSIINKTIYMIEDLNRLIANDIPKFCVKLISYYYQNKKITQSDINIAKNNLIIYGKGYLYNELTKNYYNYKESLVYKVYSLNFDKSMLSIDKIMDKVKSNDDKLFLNNYLAMHYGLRYNFEKASKLFNENSNNLYLSDDQYKWKLRVELYYKNWNKVIQIINKMPTYLSNDNDMMYWKAKAYQNLNDKKTATVILSKINDDNSYYSLLAKSELGNIIEYNKLENSLLNSSLYNLLDEEKTIINIYIKGIELNSSNLKSLAYGEWRFLLKRVSEHRKFIMSLQTYKIGLYDLSILAANSLIKKYYELSFPRPYLIYFTKYSKKNGIDENYSLAISRQESRFNYSVTAFDGGVGLMQIMPKTAMYIAKENHYSLCYASSLQCNIEFGTWYLGFLYKQLKENIIYSSIAYNAGPERASLSMLKLANVNNLIKIELVPFNITRNYVQKVIINKMFYDYNGNSKVSINLIKYINQIISKESNSDSINQFIEKNQQNNLVINTPIKNNDKVTNNYFGWLNNEDL